jgi:hypothetical protein
MSDLYHISDYDLDRYHCDSIRGPELAMIEEHLLSCVHCADREERLCAAFGCKGMVKMDHITTDDLERFQLGRIADAQAVIGIERHISKCQECADRMMAIERFLFLVRAGKFRGGFDAGPIRKSGSGSGASCLG